MNMCNIGLVLSSVLALGFGVLYGLDNTAVDVAVMGILMGGVVGVWIGIELFTYQLRHCRSKIVDGVEYMANKDV